MRYKTLFRVLLKVIGVWLFASGLTNLIGSIVQIVTFQLSSGFGAGPMPFPYWLVGGLATPLVSFVIGLYLFFGGEKIVNLAIPSNRPYCPECGYDLTHSDGHRCPECGTSLPTGAVPGEAQTDDEIRRHPPLG